MHLTIAVQAIRGVLFGSELLTPAIQVCARSACAAGVSGFYGSPRTEPRGHSLAGRGPERMVCVCPDRCRV